MTQMIYFVTGSAILFCLCRILVVANVFEFQCILHDKRVFYIPNEAKHL